MLSPGAVSLDSSGNIQASKPGPIVAASLGKSTDDTGTGRLGYLIPAATGTGGVYVFHERVSYTVRGVDLSATTYTNGSGTGSVTRYHMANGLAELTQTSTDVLTFKFYAPGTYSTSSPYAPTGATFRTMKVEKLTTGNPDNTKYSLGAKVTITIPNRADQTRTMWWNNSTTVLNAYTSLSTGVTIATSSTATTNPRTVDTTITETFTDASGTSKTLTHRTRDTVRSLKEGEEQVEAHTVFLTDNTAAGAPSLTTTYDYWPDTSAAGINRRMLHRKINADGSWEAYARLDWGSSGFTDFAVLRGWKDQTAPAVADMGSFNGVYYKMLTVDGGYAGTMTRTDKRGRLSLEEEWANGYKVAYRSDSTTGGSQTPAYPFCSVIVESAGTPGTGQGEKFFDTITTQIGWVGTNTTTAASDQADSVIPALRHRPLDVYRMKPRAAGTSPTSPIGTPNASNVLSRTRYRYQSADASTGVPGYLSTGTFTTSKAYEVVDRVEDVTHLPTLMHRTVTDRATGLTIAVEKYMITAVDANGDPTGVGTETLEQRFTLLDSRGRPVSLSINGVVRETWEYPAEDTVKHQDSDGAVFITKYGSSGRIIYTVRENVAAVSFSGITVFSAGTQAAVFTEYTYTALAGGGSQYALYQLGTVRNARAGTTFPSAILNDASSVPWTRPTYEKFDGAGRLVYTKDLLGTENAIARPTDQATSPVTLRRLGSSPAAGTILEETETYLDGRLKDQSGEAIVTQYADYAASTGLLTTYRSPYSPATGGNVVTVDGIGRTMSTSTMVPTGSNYPQAGLSFSSAWTYDDSGNILSRQVPGTQSHPYEVFSTSHSTTYGSSRTVTEALSTDAIYETTDANQAKTLTRYEKISGMWYAVRERQRGSSFITSAWSRQALGPFNTTIMHLGFQWNLTGLSQTFSGGAVGQTAHYACPSQRQTLVQSAVDSVVQQSITASCGRDTFFQTPRYERLLAYSHLGDPSSRPDPNDSRWTNVNVGTQTGLIASITTAASAELREGYVYYSGNDIRSGLVSQKLIYLSGSTPNVYYDYNNRGQLTRQWGGGDYPAQYTYDGLGRMTILETWRSGTWTGTTWPGVANPDVTEWTYSDWLDQPNVKTCMAGASGTEANARKKVRYSYYANGSLGYREWQRTGAGTATTDTVGAGVGTSYGYDAYGRLESVGYPASSAMATATPNVTFTYDSAGRIATRSDGAGTTTNTWTAWGQRSKESLITSISGVTQVTADVERTFDSSNRPDLLKAKWGTGTGMTAPDVDHGFDSYGYLNSVSTAGRSVTPALATSSMKWGTLTFTNNTTTLLTATRTLDSAGRTNYISYTQTIPSTTFRTFTYTYDRNRVTKVVHDQGNTADEMAWVYGYDSKGQVTNADKRFSTSGNPTGNFLAAYQTGYTFDEAGNRTAKDEGGSDSSTEGTGVRPTTYTTTNVLNQYTAITHPSSGNPVVQTFDVTGRRDSSSENIKVNTVLASYQANTSTGLHYNKVVTHTSTTGAGSYEDVTVTKDTGGSPTTIDSGKYYLPPPSETVGYDADGNIRQDGHWDYLWDAENRLTSQTTRHTASTTYPGLRLTFGYDGVSRRIWKKVESTTNGSTWTTASLETFLYDGWNLLMRLTIDGTGAATARQSYVWGPDIASRPTGHSSWQKAGGVGGLLMVLDKNATAYTSTGDNFFPLMDRMGNVGAYRSSDNGSSAVLSAVYEYDAFGREMKSLGSASDKMPFRFSTKYTDTESGLVYYGYRYYDSVYGKWLNRDPIGEAGGLNVFGFLSNQGLYQVDYKGLSTVSLPGGMNTPSPSPSPPITPDPNREPPPLLDPEDQAGAGPSAQQKPINNMREMIDRFLREMMKDKEKCCISELHWGGHGNGQGILLRNRDRGITHGPENSRNSDPGDYTRLNSLNADKAADYLAKRLREAGRPFCNPCVIWISSCNGAAFASQPFAPNPETSVGTVISKATGCEVRFAKGFCRANTHPERSAIGRHSETDPNDEAYPGSVDVDGNNSDYTPGWDRYDGIGLIK